MKGASRLVIDSRVGGLGDVWMRLLSLYSLAALTPHTKISIAAHNDLLETGTLLFGDRLELVKQPQGRAVIFTHLGLRHILPQLLRGQRFINPFFHILKEDRKKTLVKHYINDFLINAVSSTGRLLLPLGSACRHYQGFMEMTALRPYRDVEWNAFVAQSRRDLPAIRVRLNSRYPNRGSLPLLVFPSGKAHQVMPAAWAKAHLPEATYVFFENDSYQDEFCRLDLKVERFDSLESLLAIASNGGKFLTTDSFPSHILQTYSADLVIAMTEQISSRTVHPAFDGKVIESPAPCSPCLHIARGPNNSPCAAGLSFCKCWDNPGYSAEILGAQ